MISAFIADWERIAQLLPELWIWLREAFVTPRFAKILSGFLAEVGVLVFVFPGLEIIIRNEPNRLYTVIPWSWGITAICLGAATIMSNIGGTS